MTSNAADRGAGSQPAIRWSALPVRRSVQKLLTPLPVYCRYFDALVESARPVDRKSRALEQVNNDAPNCCSLCFLFFRIDWAKRQQQAMPGHGSLQILLVVETIADVFPRVVGVSVHFHYIAIPIALRVARI